MKRKRTSVNSKDISYFEEVRILHLSPYNPRPNLSKVVVLPVALIKLWFKQEE